MDKRGLINVPIHYLLSAIQVYHRASRSEEAARLIQSKLSLYMSEHYG